MRYALIVAAFALSACSVAKKATLPDGTQGYVISQCPDMSYCYNRAAKLCGGKYEIVSDNSGTSGAMVGGIGALSTDYSLTVRCP